MRTIRSIAAIVVCVCLSRTAAAASDDVVVSHFESLQRLEVGKGAATAEQKPRSTDSITLSFDALGRSFDLQLEPNRALLPASSYAALPSEVGVYRGRLTGAPDSWARIVLDRGVPAGLIWDGEQLFAIEAPGDSAVTAAGPVIYRLADAYVVPGTMSCGTAAASGKGSVAYRKLVGELGTMVSQAPGAVKELRLGAIGDYEFTSSKGANSESAILARLNNVDGIFSEQLGVQITVQQLETYASPADPFTGTTDANALLVELGSYRRSTPAQNSQGLTHLFTGRNLDSSTVGIAYNGALCSSQYGAGLTQGDHTLTTDSLIAAHEIGHNFGAPHDGESGSACESTPETYLMAPSVNGSDQFSPCSIGQMQDDIAGASCITALPAVDMGISLNSTTMLLLGADTVLAFDAHNNGTLDATNVEVDITLPTNVDLVSVEATGGTCSSGAGAVSCVLGTVVGSGSRSVDLTVTASSVGTGSLTAAVSADTDDRPGNNQQVFDVTVDPAVNLAIAAAGTSTVAIDQSIVVDATIGNLSVLDATDVALTVTFDDGLRADSATWTAGSCTVAPQRVDCQAASLPAASDSALRLGIAGTAAGTKHFTATLSSSEADADLSDNGFDGTVKVTSAGKENGGGGSGPPLLLLLALAGFVRGYRSRNLA
ncbi:MAG: M12 family metallo-peptidase [Woeseiaceae bacterium]